MVRWKLFRGAYGIGGRIFRAENRGVKVRSDEKIRLKISFTSYVSRVKQYRTLAKVERFSWQRWKLFHVKQKHLTARK